MVKPKARWKGLDREFCSPVTCAKFCNIVVWLMNPNIIQSIDMIILSYISFIVSCIHMQCLLRSHSIWYTFLILVSLTYCWYKDKLHFDYILWDIKTSICWYSKTTEPILMKFTGYN